MTDLTSAKSIRTVIAASSVGFGAAAILAPDALIKAYGMGDPTPDTYYLGRTWGTRTALLGALTLTAGPEEARRLAAGAAALNALDAVVALSTGGLSARHKVMAGLTSAAFCAASAYVATRVGADTDG